MEKAADTANQPFRVFLLVDTRIYLKILLTFLSSGGGIAFGGGIVRVSQTGS